MLLVLIMTDFSLHITTIYKLWCRIVNPHEVGKKHFEKLLQTNYFFFLPAPVEIWENDAMLQNGKQ